MKRWPKKILLIVITILFLGGVILFTWQYYKYRIVNKSIATAIAEQTDSLYSIKYDSLSFDEVTGNASIQNIRIIPDTNRIKKMSVESMPDILLDISIKSLLVKGVKTKKALQGNKLEGDSIIIDDPQITLLSVKPLEKGTKIQNEAGIIYKEILGKLDLIKVGFVFINNLNVKGIDFFSKDKNFDFINGKLLLEDVLIDSAHNLDTNRILFCKQANFTVDSFFSYDHNRRELSVKKIHFLGKQKELLFDQISVNRFQNDQSNGIRLLDAQKLTLNGVNTNEIVKNKNIVVDTILCKEIIFYELPVENLKTTSVKPAKNNDSTGFVNVYGVYMKYLHFPKVTFVPFAKSKYSLGNIAIKVNDVRSDQVRKLEIHPMNFTKEAEVILDRFSLKSKDGHYNYDFQNVRINSLRKELNIRSFNVVPFAPEKQFANKFHFQSDRFDVKFSGILLKNIDMNSLLDKRFEASEIVINSINAKIYRDLHKPLEKTSKVGNYLSQLLQKFEQPINISKARVNNAYIEYKENETVSDSIGVITFSNSKFNISNITNIPSAIQKNNELNISFDTQVMGSVPLNGNFKFILNSSTGNFVANGHAKPFDLLNLNRVSIPMALIKINSGKINSIDFNFTGNNNQANGKFIMKYDDLKVDVLKRDKNTNKVKKRGLASLAANLVVENKNPGSSGLRVINAKYERNIYKSFFNLVWKTVFTGMKETVGIP
ncbi:MAG: hypothetical protein ABI372_06530 [Ginsengibacter sp.]